MAIDGALDSFKTHHISFLRASMCDIAVFPTFNFTDFSFSTDKISPVCDPIHKLPLGMRMMDVIATLRSNRFNGSLTFSWNKKSNPSSPPLQAPACFGMRRE